MSETLPAKVDQVMTRQQVKEACKMGYVSGRATLSELSTIHGVAYDTLTKWSADGQWLSKREQTAKSGGGLTAEADRWLAEQRERQVRRAVSRVSRLQDFNDAVLEKASLKCAEDPDFLPFREIQAIATSEEKLDAIARRNLGLDQGSGTSVHVNVNALGGVQIDGLGG